MTEPPIVDPITIHVCVLCGVRCEQVHGEWGGSEWAHPMNGCEVLKRIADLEVAPVEMVDARLDR